MKIRTYSIDFQAVTTVEHFGVKNWGQNCELRHTTDRISAVTV